MSPSLNPTPGGETLLVWGASPSVGSNAVQLATASGYAVIATASPRNHDLVRKLGAAEVFNHGDGKVVENLVAALKGKRLVGAFNVTGNLADTYAVLRRSEGRRYVTVTCCRRA